MSEQKMVLASTDKLILGTIAFIVFWVLAVFPSVPFLPIGRTAGSLLGAMLMVIFKVFTPTQAYQAVDLSILGLLFGTMVVSIYLERADMFKYLRVFLMWKSKGVKDLLCRICFVTAVSSAFFTNDTSCVVLTEFVLKLARQNNVAPHPFLLALASSANIGSSTTPIGNPQNLVIAIQSKISFGEFLLGILPSMLVGVLVNVALLLSMYWKLLSVKNDPEIGLDSDVMSEVDVSSHRFSPTRMSHPALESQELTTPVPMTEIVIPSVTVSEDEDSKENLMKKWKIVFRKASVYLVTIGMLVAFLMGLDMSWTALTAALILVALDFKDARPCLEKVSYSLLVFFCGMFITVEGFNRTGIPSTLWNLTEPHARIDSVSGIVILAVVVLLLSNIASNVPTVLLLGGRVAASAAAVSPSKEKKAWLILAWVSTVAGNLSLLGSAANLIVCEQARNSKIYSYHLSFWNHLKFGVPSTLIVIAIGLTLIRD